MPNQCYALGQEVLVTSLPAAPHIFFALRISSGRYSKSSCRMQAASIARAGFEPEFSIIIFEEGFLIKKLIMYLATKWVSSRELVSRAV